MANASRLAAANVVDPRGPKPGNGQKRGQHPEHYFAERDEALRQHLEKETQEQKETRERRQAQNKDIPAKGASVYEWRSGGEEWWIREFVGRKNVDTLWRRTASSQRRYDPLKNEWDVWEDLDPLADTALDTSEEYIEDRDRVYPAVGRSNVDISVAYDEDAMSWEGCTPSPIPSPSRGRSRQPLQRYSTLSPEYRPRSRSHRPRSRSYSLPRCRYSRSPSPFTPRHYSRSCSPFTPRCYSQSHSPPPRRRYTRSHSPPPRRRYTRSRSPPPRRRYTRSRSPPPRRRRSCSPPLRHRSPLPRPAPPLFPPQEPSGSSRRPMRATQRELDKWRDMEEALRAALGLGDTTNDIVDERRDVEAIGSMLRYRYGFTCPSDHVSTEETSQRRVARLNWMLSFDAIQDPIPEEWKEAVGDFVGYLSASLPPPPALCDVVAESPAPFRHTDSPTIIRKVSFQHKLLQSDGKEQIEDCDGYLLQPRDLDGSSVGESWQLIVLSATTAAEVVRRRLGPFKTNVVRELAAKGAPFMTVVPGLGTPELRLPLSSRPKMDCGLGIRLPNFKAEPASYTIYEDMRDRFLASHPHAAQACLGAGGIIWRLTVEALTPESILDGPQAKRDRQKTVFVDGKTFITDALTPDEEQLVCGVYHILQGT